MADRFDDEGFIAGSFEPIKIYDAPMVAVSQMFDGEASFRSLMDTFLDPASLSPVERDSYVSRLKQSTGNNPLSNALLDIALNPFVWLMFVTSPAAGRALSAAGRTFGGRMIGPAYKDFATGKFSALSALGLLNAHQMGAGTPLPDILNSAMMRFNELTRADRLVFAPYEKEIFERLSIKFGTRVTSLDPRRAPNAVATIDGEAVSLKEYLEKFNTYAHIQMAGMHKNVIRKKGTIVQNAQLVVREKGKGDKFYRMKPTDIETYNKFRSDQIMQRMKLQDAIDRGDGETARSLVAGLKKMKENFHRKIAKSMGITEDLANSNITASPERAGKLPFVPGETPIRVIVNSQEVAAIDPENLSGRWLEREGFMPYLGQARDKMKERYVDLFGKRDVFDKTGELEYDDNKLLRLFRSLSSAKAGRSADEMSSVLHREFQGVVGQEGYEKILQALRKDSEGRQKMKLEDFKTILQQVRMTSDDLDNYMPRNVWSYVEHTPSGGIDKFRTDSLRHRFARKDRVADISGRASERMALANPFMDEDDLGILAADYAARGRSSAALDDAIKASREYQTQAVPKMEDARGQVMNLDFSTGIDRYLRQTRSDVVLHVDDASVDEFILNAKKSREWTQMLRAGRPAASRIAEREALKDMGRTRYDYLRFASDAIARSEGSLSRRGGERAAEYVMGTLVDRMRGAVPLNDMISEMVTLKALDMARNMAGSSAFQKLKGMGGIPRKFVTSLERYGDMSLSEIQGGGLGRGLTSLFYTSHLGFNLGSAVLNLMQPLMYAAAWMDPDVMIRAYGQGLRQYFGYIQERMKLGVRADPLTVDELRKKHFRLSNMGTDQYQEGIDLLDIRKTDHEILDSEIFANRSSLTDPKGGAIDFWASEVPMKLFTHTEMFNRIVTGEAMLGQLQKAGRIGDIKAGANGVYRSVGGRAEFGDVEVANNVRQMVQNTQFGSDLINSPALFQNSGFGVPWVRQFFTFPLRTLTNLFDTVPMVNNGRRTWGMMGFETKNAFAAVAHDTMRMMGMGAVIYEAGKNLAGIDLSRGLAGQALYDSTIVGPALLSTDQELAYNLPMPPAVSAIRDFTQALTQDDISILGTFAPRFVPGGIALSRALNAFPRFSEPKGWFGGLQRESADWGNVTPEGQVPIYRADGSLLEYRSAARTVLGSLGFSSYMFQNDKALNAFLVKNRAAVVAERRKYMDAVLANNMDRANKIKAAFEKRFKFPLSVSKDQVERALQLREVPLKERMYQRLQPEFRPVVRPYLEERLETLKARTPEELDLSTAEKARVLPSTFESFDPFSVVTE